MGLHPLVFFPAGSARRQLGGVNANRDHWDQCLALPLAVVVLPKGRVLNFGC